MPVLHCPDTSATFSATDTTPPKEILRSGKTTFAEVVLADTHTVHTTSLPPSPSSLPQAGFLPAAIVHLGTESLQWPLLSEESLSHAQSALQAEVVQAGARERQR